MTEFNRLLGSKCCCIISDDLSRTTKSREDMSLYEFYDDTIIGLTRRDGFYPLGEVVYCSENPFMLGR